MRVTVVIPTYNEAENLPRLVSALFSLPLAVSVFIVDDNSPDGTGRIADQLAAEHKGRVSVLHRPGKMGLRSAYLNSFQKLLETDAEAIVQMDSDFSHDPAFLPEMVAQLSQCDIVLGSRYIPGGGVDRNWSAFRKWLSSFGNLYSRSILRIPVRDLTTGYRVWKRETLMGMPLERVQSSGYVFQVEMAYLAHCLGYKIREYPIYFPDRQFGKSKITFRIQVEAAIRIWEVLWSYRDIRKAGHKARV